MTNLDPLFERNRAFAATGVHAGLTPIPRLGVFVVTCIDSRVDPARILGLELGEALVLRNGGGRVTREVIEEIAFVGHVTETMFGDAAQFEVAVLHHTECGTGVFADEQFRRSFADRVGADEAALAAQAVTEPIATVLTDVDRLRRSPLLPGRVSVSGHVYDVHTGLVQTVVPSTVDERQARA